ncbi:TPA: staphylococcal enterotoxin type T, partial [Staphylococcus aureus]|nr:staphylococcal enterotoxin type T [Staphylococcus aureus]
FIPNAKSDSREGLKDFYSKKIDVYTNKKINEKDKYSVDIEVDNYVYRINTLDDKILNQFKVGDYVDAWGHIINNKPIGKVIKFYDGDISKHSPLDKPTNISYRINLFKEQKQTEVTPEKELEIGNRYLTMKQIDYRIKSYLVKKQQLYTEFYNGKIEISMLDGKKHFIDLSTYYYDPSNFTLDYTKISHFDIYMEK